jgi:putative membrane protein insertion efficiency factor
VSRRARFLIILVVVAVLLAIDFTRPPRHQLTARLLVGSIHAYQATFSKLMPKVGVRCRFRPTCSHYGEGAIRKYGTLKGIGKTVWRIARCGPWTPQGTYDPP